MKKRTFTPMAFLAAFLLLACAAPSRGQAIFLTGHDTDFHAVLADGPKHYNQVAIDYVTDPDYNLYSLLGVNKFLFVSSSIAAPGGHTDGEQGIMDSGYLPGADYDHVDASGLHAALDELGTTYNAIVVASDFGGILTQAELDILNDRADDIEQFLNLGGGLYAMAEGNSGAGLTPNGGHFAFLPFDVASVPFNNGNPATLTAFGESLGLTAADEVGLNQHCFFTNAAGMNVVDVDAFGSIITLARRTPLMPHKLKFYLHGHDIPGTADGFTMNDEPANSHLLALNLLSRPRWYSEPTVTGTFQEEATFKLVMPRFAGLNVGVTYKLSATNPDGGDEVVLGEVTELLGVGLGPKTVNIPVTTPVTMEGQRLKLTISSAVKLNVNLRLGDGAYVEATEFVGSP